MTPEERSMLTKLVMGYQKQIQYYSSILNYDKNLLSLINEGLDEQEMIKILMEKQHLITEISKIDQEIKNNKELFERYKTYDEPIIHRINKAISKIKDILEESLSIEKELSEKMKKSQENLKQQQGNLNAGKRAVNAYLKPGNYNGGKFKDGKS